MSLPPPDWPNATVSRSVRLGPIDWHVQVTGSGPTLLLLHGTGASTHSWAPLFPLLADAFTLVAVDLPGHAFTKGRPAGGLTIAEIGSSIAALMAKLDLAPALIVGHSAGVAVAIELAASGAFAPKGVIGIGAALLPFPGVAKRLFPAMARMLFVNPLVPIIVAGLASRPGAVADMLPRLTGSRIAPAMVDLYARLFRRTGHVAGTIGMMAAWDLDPVKAALPRLGIPLLLIHGDHDETIPLSAARETSALAQGSELAVLAGGHLVHEETPEAVAMRILAFARAQHIV